jgi:hypothetical protein
MTLLKVSNFWASVKKNSRKDAETQRTRKVFSAAIAKNKLHHKDHKGHKVFLDALCDLCGLNIFAKPLRLRVFACAFVFGCGLSTLGGGIE